MLVLKIRGVLLGSLGLIACLLAGCGGDPEVAATIRVVSIPVEGAELLVNGEIFSTERIFTAVAAASNAFAGTGFSAGEYNDLERVKVKHV